MIKILLLFSLLFLAACSSGNRLSKNRHIEKAPAIYTVKKGDTLFRIGWRYGLTAKTIMKKNGLSNPNKIYVGQKLRLRSGGSDSRSSAYHAKPKKSHIPKKGPWVWPIHGAVVSNFRAGKIGANGLRIAGKPQQSINAAEAGIVAYKGNGLNGYGNVVIIKHKKGLLSAYGFLSKTYVKEGQRIRKRQKIGSVGYAANNKLMLHFEIRKNGTPVNPLLYTGSKYHF